jgi:hypothetical protein
MLMKMDGLNQEIKLRNAINVQTTALNVHRTNSFVLTVELTPTMMELVLTILHNLSAFLKQKLDTYASVIWDGHTHIQINS